jgi:hypothetical protein
MALDGGASRVSLLGIDLGTADRPDAAHAPLAALLQLLAWLSPVAVLDCGAGGAHKRGWQRSALAAAAGARLTGPCEVVLDEAPDAADRLAQACADLRALSPILDHARELLETAIAARTYPAGASVSRLGDAVTGMLGWGTDVRTRILLQEGLGLAFLPRFWRSGIDLTLGTALWRPLLLATHELIGQAHALAGAVAERKAA